MIESKLTTNDLEMYKKIVDHMWESVWIWDSEEKTIYANPNFCKLMEYSLEEMIWIKSYEFRDPESAKVVANNNELRKDWQASKYEWVLKSKTWKLVPVLCSWTPIPWWWTVWIMTDLRKVKALEKIEEDLKKLNETKNEFISIVWHELRTPLTALRWYLSMALNWDYGDLNEDLNDALLHSYESSVRLIELVWDMLDLSKIESNNMIYYKEEYLIEPIIIKVEKDISLLMKEKWLKFILDYDKDLLENRKILVDENKLKQVLINLLNNAMKFTNKWWSIFLIIRKEWEEVLFSVKDTWIWIPQDKIKNLFAKFYQVDNHLQRNAWWLWLWLSLCKNFVESFWWKINVESKEWEWSNFYFKLKLV